MFLHKQGHLHVMKMRRCVNIIKETILELFDVQDIFERKTIMPWDMAQWDYEELQSFEISLGEVERLYPMSNQEDDDSLDREYNFMVRVHYKDQPL